MLYNKIYGPFKRDLGTNKVVPGEWNDEAVRALANVPIWQITEKIDGTNVRIIWDGFRVTIGGRTDKAQMPQHLLDALDGMFPEERFEQVFGDTPVILFGEGYGPKIQSGGKYRDDVSFAMFDAAVNGKYLRPGDTERLAMDWGIEHAPIINRHPWTLNEAIADVEKGFKSRYGGGSFEAEGLVAKTYLGLLDHRGNRLVVKIKGVDFA